MRRDVVDDGEEGGVDCFVGAVRGREERVDRLFSRQQGVEVLQ